MSKKIIGILLTATLAIVFTASLSYVFSQPNPTQSNPSPTLTPTPIPTSAPTPSPSPKPTGPASISKPSIPEFTLKYVDLSYYEPPTYGIDQFTGETVITQEGYYVDNKSVAFKIKNQPFSSYNDSSGNSISLYYNFRFKGHFGDEWLYYPFSESGGSTHRYSAMFYVLSDQSPKLKASDSKYTDMFLGLPFLFGEFNPQVGSQVDFQVQALIGHTDSEGYGFSSYTGQRSDWSNTQTITIS